MEPGFFLYQKKPGQLEPKRGERVDIKGALSGCSSIDELVTKHPDVAYKGLLCFTRYYQLQNRTLMDSALIEIKCYWLYGESGAGKSFLCHQLALSQLREGEHIYRHNNGNYAWWDGYAGHEIVIMEELRRNKIKEAGGLA